MPKIVIADNQWWYSKYPLGREVAECQYVVLNVGGRQCPMVHSELGKDGRPTHSFKFVNREDVALWRSLAGSEVEVAIDYAGPEDPPIDLAFGDDSAIEHVDSTVPVQHLRAETTVRRAGVTRFDAYVFVDFSANSEPKAGKDSIWVGEGVFVENVLVVSADRASNPRTRADCASEIAGKIRGHVEAGRKVLLGLDIPYGYPHDAYPLLFPNTDSPTWSTLWSHLEHHVEDLPSNRNNRFEVAAALNELAGGGVFWGCPVSKAGPHLRPTKSAPVPTPEYRIVEQRLRASRRRAFSPFQLFGNGSVGSQAILGMAMLHRLRSAPELRGLVWPYETGFELPEGADVVHAEIWPGCIDVDLTLHPVRDAAQVLSYVKWAASHDAAGSLAGYFSDPTTNQEERSAVLRREGWILGVGSATPRG